MSEPINFEHLAELLAADLADNAWVHGRPFCPTDGMMVDPDLIAEQLRHIWNARGAADIEALDNCGTQLAILDHMGVLKKLDR